MPVFYPGSAGFIVGAAFGLLLGLSWKHYMVPGQRMKAVVCMAYDGLDVSFSQQTIYNQVKKNLGIRKFKYNLYYVIFNFL